MKTPYKIRTIQFLMVMGAVTLAAAYLPRSSFFPRSSYGPILHEEESDYSRIRVRGSGKLRHLLFVSDIGKEQLQSSVDLDDPGTLQVPYTRTLFASFLFRNPQDRILIIGLGGGGMVRFLHHHFPESRIEAVEIDPAVVRIADDFFETRESQTVTIHREDAFEFLQRKHPPYDAIYLDAFLRPSIDSQSDGKTARLKTVAFLRTVSSKLTPKGVVACNLIRHRATTPDDLDAFREVFPTVLAFAVPGTGNLAVIASKVEYSFTRGDWIEKGRQLEQDLPVGLSFSGFARSLQEDPNPN